MKFLIALIFFVSPVVWAASPQSTSKRPAEFQLAPPLPADVQKAILVAEQMEKEGAYDAARRQLAAVIPNLPLERVASLWVRICYLWEVDGAQLQARDCYLELSERLRGVEPHNASLSSYRAAVILSKRNKRREALGELRAIIEQMPGELGAQRALALARELHREKGGAKAEAHFLKKLSQTVGKRHLKSKKKGDKPYIRRLVAEMLVRAGQLFHSELSSPHRALPILSQAVALGEDTVWWDDALIWQARSAVANKSYPQGLAAYKKLINSMESSWFVGSYDSEFMDEAHFEYATTLKTMGRIDEARVAFRNLIQELPTSRLKDDAAYELALLEPQEKRKQALQKFMRVYPGSRYTKRAKKALGQ